MSDKYEEPTIEYDGDGYGGDLVQPMCSTVVYPGAAVADFVGGANWALVANGVILINAIGPGDGCV